MGSASPLGLDILSDTLDWPFFEESHRAFATPHSGVMCIDGTREFVIEVMTQCMRMDNVENWVDVTNIPHDLPNRRQ